MYVGRKAQGGTGKGHYVNRSLHAETRNEAERALTALKHELDTQTYVPSSALTVGEYLDRWVTGKADVSAKTRKGYEQQLAGVTASLGDCRLSSLTQPMVQGYLTGLTTSGLSPRTVKCAATVLRGALTDAVENAILVRNPAAKITLPRQVRRPATVLSMEQVRALLGGTVNDRHGMLWRFLLTTGARPQEALALKWDDIDFEGSWVSIRRALVNDGSGHYALSSELKTASSIRRLGLPASTVDGLRSLQQRQELQSAAQMGYDRKLGLVFCTRLGTPLDIPSVRRAWKATLERLGLPKIRLYDCRHTHLTALLASGVDIALVAARAGHSNIQTTVSHYAHVLPESHREMGQVTERLVMEPVR